MTGLPIDDNGVYQLLLTRDRETLGDVFVHAGYRVAALLPGLRSAWPEGAFYDFATIYDARALGYPGPDFGWWRIPDQYALAKADALEIEPDARQPVLLFFATISTHLPFKPTPPYQPDWARLLSAKPYAGTPASERLEEMPQWTDMRPAYADTLIYTYEYLSGYLQQRRNRDLILIVLGDHQPAANVSGEDARWDVPVHVIASRGEILDALLDAGFSPGLEPEAHRSGRCTS